MRLLAQGKKALTRIADIEEKMADRFDKVDTNNSILINISTEGFGKLETDRKERAKKDMEEKEKELANMRDEVMQQCL